MCGIVGIHDALGMSVDDGDVHRMLTALAHRGPDAQGFYNARNIGFGAARLSLNDLNQRSAQPLVIAGGQRALVYNGELYNWRELRAQLEHQFEFRTTSDTEVLAAAVSTWGVAEAVRRFDGMFAFAYFDGRSLWLGRDRLGIKPLYVARRGPQLAFASEIKPLLQLPAVTAQPNLPAIFAGLMTDSLEEPWTAFAGVDAVPRGEVWQIHPDGSIDREQYWDVLAALDLDRLLSNRTSMGAATEQLDAKVRAAVHSQMSSDAPVAVFCSGGLDSSLVAAYALEVEPDMRAFTADVDGAKPELDRASRVAEVLGFQTNAVRVRNVDYLRAWPLAVWHGEAPISVQSNPAFLLLSQACRESGFKGALSGEGADELFCGYPWQHQAAVAWRWHSLQCRLGLTGRLGAVSRVLSRLIPADEVSLRAQTFGNFDSPDPTLLMRQSSGLHGGLKASRHRAIDSRLASYSDLAERGLIAASVNSMYGHLGVLLNRNDHLGMATSLEIRVPYLSNDIIDFALHLPIQLRFHRKTGKRVLKNVARRYFPRDIVDFPKWGFAVDRTPFSAVAPLIRSGMTPDLLGWTPAITEELLGALTADRKPFVLFLIGSLELWCRIFLDGQSPEELGEKLTAADRTMTSSLIG